MRRKKVLFVRPPRYLAEAMINMDVMHLNFPCLAAVLRKEMEDVEIKIVDCVPLRIGWKSLESIIEKERADIVGVGDTAISHLEGVRVLDTAKKANPHVITIAGGIHFSSAVDYSLGRYPIDYIVRYEGEHTLLELLRVLIGGGEISKVRGLAYREDGKIIKTPFRPLVSNLDDLPIPAYDLMPMHLYNHKGLGFYRVATIQHSRGCVASCKFCVPMMQQAEHYYEEGEHRFRPRYRTKSVERAVEEVELLHKKHGCRSLWWIDSTWNVDAKWTDRFCEEIVKRKLTLPFMALLRADFLVRDEKSGVLEKMVRAGLRVVFIGVERVEDKDFKEIGKGNISNKLNTEAFHILKTKYPEVFRAAGVMIGLRSEREADVRFLIRGVRKMLLQSTIDYAPCHIMTPFPGTLLWKEALKKGLIADFNFTHYDTYKPVMNLECLSLNDVKRLRELFYGKIILYQILSILRGFVSRSRHRRIFCWNVVLMGTKLLYCQLKGVFLNRKSWSEFFVYHFWEKPKWYDR